MRKCTHCSREVVDPVAVACPYCGTPMTPNAGTAAPPKRVSLTGEVIEGDAPPIPQPGTRQPLSPPIPTPGTRQPISPVATRPTPAAPIQPVVLAAERRIYQAAAVVAVILLALLVVGGVALRNRYAESQKRFDQQSHLHLSTPTDAASEIVNSLKDEATARLYLCTEFADDKMHLPQNALAFASGYHNAAAGSAIGGATLKAFWASIDHLQFGEPTGKGDLQDVPVKMTVTVNGVTKSIQGVVHLINAEDGKWRLNCSTISVLHPTRESIGRYEEILAAILGEAPAPREDVAPASPSQASPAYTSQPAQPPATGEPGYPRQENTPVTPPSDAGPAAPSQPVEPAQTGVPANTPPANSEQQQPADTPPANTENGTGNTTGGSNGGQ